MSTKFGQQIRLEELTHSRLIKQVLVITITVISSDFEKILNPFYQRLLSPNVDIQGDIRGWRQHNYEQTPTKLRR